MTPDYTHKNFHLLGSAMLNACVKYLYFTKFSEENKKEAENINIALETVSVLNSVESKL